MKQTKSVRRQGRLVKKVKEKECPQKNLSRMAIEARNNEDEESGEIENEGEPTEETFLNNTVKTTNLTYNCTCSILLRYNISVW